MPDQSTIYPNINWHQFVVFNDNTTDAFEEMCKDLFYCEYLHETRNPHADHNNPGVEVLPILEPVRDDGEPQKLVSFQAKYFEQTISNSQVIKSLKQAVSHYKGQLGRVYLFCNKVISKDSERFRKYQAVLSPASIELELVTDKDIFTLLRKHKRVADYYFQDRKRTVAGAGNLMGSPMISSSVSENSQSDEHKALNPLLQELLKDRIDNCKEAIIDLNFGKLKIELSILNTAVEADSRIAFYQLILAAHNRENFDELLDRIPENYKEEAYWLKGLCKTPRDISIEEIKGFSAETQTVPMVVIFAEQHWDCIVKLHNYREDVDPSILRAFDYHYALALFNLRREDEAHNVLSELFRQYHEPRFELFDICAQLNKANQAYVYGKPNQEQMVMGLLSALDRVKELSSDQIKSNGNLIATIELQSCFNLGATQKKYIDEAIIRYTGFTEEIRNFEGVRFFMALCYEMGGDLEKACELFAQCDWRGQEDISARYMTLLIDLRQPEKAIDVYKEIRVKSPRIECVYLLALSRTKNANYETSLKVAVDKHRTSLDDLFLYGFYVENKDIFRSVVMPALTEAFSIDLDSTTLQTKIGLIAMLAHNGEIESIETVLNTISDIEVINMFAVHDIYRCLYSETSKAYELWRHDKATGRDMLPIERIANRFYENNVHKREFLQIKMMCAAVSHMDISMLKYSTELFEYTHDVQTARNIIALLYKRNETRKEEYEPYLEPLMDSDDPQISIAASSALWKLGKYDDADFYAYKALYNLNGKDDVDVYKGLFGYHNINMQRIQNMPERKTIAPNMVVTLQSEGTKWVVALDSESDFGDRDNRSLGAEHINKQDQVYNKLLGSGKNQVLNLRGRSYKVIGFEPREITIGRIVFQKVMENPDKFNVRTISSENPEEMVKQLLALSDQKDHLKKMTDMYNFKDSQLGLPLDMFSPGSYEKYIATMQYLLYTKDLAYYAGEPRIENFVEAKYVPTLSTFVLLAMNGWLDQLDWLKDYIIIPDSYIEFFKEQYSYEMGTQAISAGTLVPLEDGKFTILEKDKRIPEIWESIIEKCEMYTTTAVTDEERIAFEIVEKYTWERLFGKSNIDKMQLDGLIVAERENGVYLCDDLFFRKIAAGKKIKNINFATLLYVIEDQDIVMPIILDLSKTNYIYTPIRSRDDDELEQLFNNLLEGEMKNKYYSEVFNAYLYAWDQAMKEYFGENWKDKIEPE